jgi:hypothetical protein
MILKSEFPVSFTIDDGFDNKQLEEEFEEDEEGLEGEGLDTFDEFGED